MEWDNEFTQRQNGFLIRDTRILIPLTMLVASLPLPVEQTVQSADIILGLLSRWQNHRLAYWGFHIENIIYNSRPYLTHLVTFILLKVNY